MKKNGTLGRHNENHHAGHLHNEKSDDGGVKRNDVYHENGFCLCTSVFVFCYYCPQEMDFCVYCQNGGAKP